MANRKYLHYSPYKLKKSGKYTFKIREGKARSLYAVTIQNDDKQHHRNLFRDKSEIALPPGKRVSENGKIYYEYRSNRSDIKHNL